MGTILHVGNLTTSTTEAELTSWFEKFGTVESTRISRDRKTGRSRGFGQVRMASAIEAETAIARLHLTQRDGLTMVVNKSTAGWGNHL
jgi:RNA recognition motif-containing protein